MPKPESAFNRKLLDANLNIVRTHSTPKSADTLPDPRETDSYWEKGLSGAARGNLRYEQASPAKTPIVERIPDHQFEDGPKLLDRVQARLNGDRWKSSHPS